MEATQGLAIHSQAPRACKYIHYFWRLLGTSHLQNITEFSRVEAVPQRSPLLVLQFPEGKSLLTVDWVGVLARFASFDDAF